MKGDARTLSMPRSTILRLMDALVNYNSHMLPQEQQQTRDRYPRIPIPIPGYREQHNTTTLELT